VMVFVAMLLNSWLLEWEDNQPGGFNNPKTDDRDANLLLRHAKSSRAYRRPGEQEATLLISCEFLLCAATASAGRRDHVQYAIHRPPVPRERADVGELSRLRGRTTMDATEMSGRVTACSPRVCRRRCSVTGIWCDIASRLRIEPASKCAFHTPMTACRTSRGSCTTAFPRGPVPASRAGRRRSRLRRNFFAPSRLITCWPGRKTPRVANGTAAPIAGCSRGRWCMKAAFTIISSSTIAAWAAPTLPARTSGDSNSIALTSWLRATFMDAATRTRGTALI